MAAFGGGMSTVRTPDGRTLNLPSEVAAMFPGLQPAAIAAPPGGGAGPELPPGGPGPAPAGGPLPLPAGGAPAWGPADTAALATQTPPPDAATAPVTTPAQVPQAGPRAQPQAGPVTEPGPEQGTQKVAPAPPMTKEQLAQQAYGAGLEGESQAINARQAANTAAAKVDADTATQQGEALAARDAETHRIVGERAMAAQENQQRLDAMINERDLYAKKIADTKIDRSIDHPILAAIGLALGTIGGAMQQKQFGGGFHNAALDTLMAQIDRKVAGQMADLDKQRASLAQMNVNIGERRSLNRDRLDEIDARKDAAIQQAKLDVETIATKQKSPAAMAAAGQINAGLEAERQKLRESYGERAQAQLNTEAARKQQAAEAAASRAVQIRGQDLTYQAHREQLEATEREKMAQVAAQLLKEGKDKDAAKAKAVAEHGIFDPRTGRPMLSVDGQAKLARADRVEAEARQQKDPAVAARLRQVAAELRQSAQLNDAVVAPSKEAAEKLRPQVSAAQNATDEIGSAIRSLETDPSAFNREQWAGIATRLGNLANVYQKTIGERISVRAFEQTMKHILEFDPDSYFDRVASQNRALESLKTLKNIVATDVKTTLAADGIQTDWRPIAQGEDSTSFDVADKTAQELGAAENGGVLARAGARILTAGTKSYDDFGFQQQAEERASARPGSEGGLPPNATTRIKMLAQAADAAGDADHQKIIESIRAPIVSGLQGGRQSVANGVLTVLRGANPGVYSEVVAGLPEPVRKQIEQIDAARAALPGRALPPPSKTPSGFDPDEAARETAAREEAAAAKRVTTDRKAYQGAYQKRAAAGARGTP